MKALLPERMGLRQNPPHCQFERLRLHVRTGINDARVTSTTRKHESFALDKSFGNHKEWRSKTTNKALRACPSRAV